MEIRIEPCTVSDGPAIAHNSLPAFWQDASFRVPWRGKTIEHVAAQAALRGSSNLLRSLNQRRHQKAVDPRTGGLVGYARWLLPTDGEEDGLLWPEARVEAVSEEVKVKVEEDAKRADWAPALLEVDVDEPASRRRAELIGGKRYLQLHYLAVHPRYQKQGIGTALVKSGVAAADRMGLDCFVDAYAAGLQTYYNAGFVLLDEVVVDDSVIGGPGKYSHFLMERKCSASKSS